MSESAVVLSALAHGVASGAMLVIALVVWRSALSIHVRAGIAMAAVSIVAWMITESPQLSAPMGPAITLLLILAAPVSGLFWLMLLTVFDDWRITPATLAPAAIFLITCPLVFAAEQPVGDVVWAGRNLAAALLAIHAGVLILRGRRDDLVEGRRRFRAVLLAIACLYVVLLVGSGFAARLDPDGPWLLFVTGRPLGGLLLAALILSLAMLALQVQPSTFGASRRLEPAGDARAEAADRHLLAQLNGVMEQGGWRQEGLTIGGLASALGVPEHRLRRLINQRLGHRNFAEFLNAHRIEAAKRRLADPAEARVTVAAIAFDLGYGSLGPFNRAFRATTGASPTEWRRQALVEASPEMKQAV